MNEKKKQTIFDLLNRIKEQVKGCPVLYVECIKRDINGMKYDLNNIKKMEDAQRFVEHLRRMFKCEINVRAYRSNMITIYVYVNNETLIKAVYEEFKAFYPHNGEVKYRLGCGCVELSNNDLIIEIGLLDSSCQVETIKPPQKAEYKIFCDKGMEIDLEELFQDNTKGE